MGRDSKDYERGDRGGDRDRDRGSERVDRNDRGGDRDRNDKEVEKIGRSERPREIERERPRDISKSPRSRSRSPNYKRKDSLERNSYDRERPRNNYSRGG